jgi:hypothetical protein
LTALRTRDTSVLAAPLGRFLRILEKRGVTMEQRRVALTISLGLIFSSVPLAAHHSFEAEYDFNRTVKVTGTVTKVEWMNPHARVYVDVTDEKGKVTNWNFELGPINILLKNGWRKNSLKAGDQVTVEGFLSKVGDALGNARKITLPDGRRVLGGSSADNPQ